MNKNKNSRGAAAAAIILAVLVFGIVLGVYKFISQKQSSSSEKNFVEESLPEESLVEESSENPNQNEFGSGQGSRGSEVAEGETVLEQNFSETGGLTDWDSNAEKQTGNWVLLYDKPGRLALTVKLALNDKSVCDFDNGEEKCDFSKFELGMFAKVEGYEKDGVVTVTKITKQTVLGSQ